VLRLVEEAGTIVGVEFKEKGIKKRAFAPLTICADGLFSKFRQHFIRGKTEAASSFVGIVMKDVKLPYPDKGHVVLMDPAPVLIYPISSEDVRVLVDIPNPLPSNATGELKKYLLEQTAKNLPDSLKEPFIKTVETSKLRVMPCGRLHTETVFRKGAVLLGDAFNVRHPLTGAGMTVAFGDVVALTQAFKGADLYCEKELRERTKLFYKIRKPLASTINILAAALYSVFSAADDPSLPEMREACFQYFKMGGACVAGPMGLLGGITPNPSLLTYHFFSVAFVAVGRQLWPVPTPGKAIKAWKVLKAASNIVLPLLRDEGMLPVFGPAQKYPGLTHKL